VDLSPYNGRLCGCGAPLQGKQRTTCELCRRRRDRHRTVHRERRPGKRASKPAARFAGVDGESIDGEYVMLTWATDDGAQGVAENRDGAPLTTQQCLQFLCAIPKGVKCWGFAFGYDVNMMLGDLREDQVQRLHTFGSVLWRNYRISYIPGSLFRVSHLDARRKSTTTTTIWDLWKWVQTSFAIWIGPDGWNLASPDEVARIQTMKDKRSTFDAAHLDDIRRYNLSECVYMAQGARRLTELISEAGVNVRGQYHSAASIAKAMMRDHHVTDYRRDPPKRLAQAIDEAYFGGRAEVSEVGPITGPVYSYDINSAYPTNAVKLPCLACGSWHRSRSAARGWPVRWSSVHPWSLVRVSWRPVKGTPKPMWGPLPVRPKTGSNRWPTHGTGWYWGVEVLAARRHATIDVKDCWTYTTPCDHEPFGYLADLYTQRRALKAAGDPTEFVLKGALNSTYGALAEKPHRDGKQPRNRCLAWAGWITAATRATLLDVLDDDVVLMATDGILRRTPLDVPVGKQMGEWDADTFDEAWCAGTGIYFATQNGTWVKNKTRGFERGDLSIEMFLDLWQGQGRVGKIKLSRSRFIGMGVALQRIHGMQPPHARLWRTFIDERVDKSLDAAPRRTWLTDDVRDGRTRAPSLKEHRAIERIDAADIQRWYEEYEVALTQLAKWQETDAHWPPPHSPLHLRVMKKMTPTEIAQDEQMNEFLHWKHGRDLHARLLVLGSKLAASERRLNGSLFSWADDPDIG
jgi:hypothetical protein